MPDHLRSLNFTALL